MELVLIQQNSPEWEAMWNWLANHPINAGFDEPSVVLNEGEGWAYMGSYKQGERVLHSFRHRKHPVTNGVKTMSVKASEVFTEDQIVKKFNL